jgi:YegS/Rv2252/BmrU family lipid kinase
VKVAAIINPISGAGADADAATRRVAMLNEQLERRGLRAAIALTTHRGHARELAAAAARDRADLAIVWGGDGTVNEAGTSLLGSETALGLVPAGSGNGLAAALGTPRDPAAAIALALDGQRRRIDAGTIAGRPFFNIAGIGVDARIARRFNERGKGARGPGPYFAIGISEGYRYRAQEYDVELDGDRWTLRALLIAFANGREYGTGATLCAAACLDDGLLDAVVVEDRSVVARFWHARHLASGTPDRAPRVIARSVRHARIRSDAPMEYHVDGEVGRMEGEIEVTIKPGALWISGK